MSQRQAPAPRDQRESPFAHILGGFWRAHPAVLAAIFVDREGECIDYCSSLDPFDAKVAAAHMVAILATLGDACQGTGMGLTRVWTIEAEQRDFVMVRVSDDYCVVLVLDAGGLSARVLEALDGLIEAFSEEAGLRGGIEARAVVEAGDDGEPLWVVLPQGRVRVARVLARWLEPGVLSDTPRECFRVQLALMDTPAATERTLVHDRHQGSFRVRRNLSTGC